MKRDWAAARNAALLAVQNGERPARRRARAVIACHPGLVRLAGTRLLQPAHQRTGTAPLDEP
jgi:hypothetical protein